MQGAAGAKSQVPDKGARMTNQIGDLKAVLENKRAELLRSIRSQGSQLTVSEGEPDLIDRMQSMSRRDEVVAFLDALTRTLAEVDAALGAMKEGSYGTCVACEGPIASRRLQTIPWASHCIRCQESLEHRRQMRNGAPLWDEAA
jgi:RNA polymerase-binding transcription factor DksA